MVKNKKTKLIISISLLSVLGILIITTIVLACLKKDYNVNVNDPYQIRIYSTENSNFYEYTFDKEDQEYKDIMKLYNESSVENYLTLFLAGKLNKESYIDNLNSQTSVISNVINKNPDHYYVEFVYGELNNLMLNDEPFYKAGTDDVVRYNKLLLEVKNTSSVEEVKIYVENYSQYSTTNSISSSYQFVTYANQGELYDLIAEIVK